jgi:Fur family ferric uptake transcriptional regulator
MSTIYRTLDFFIAKGLVTRSAVTENQMALYELTPKQHRHYAICTNCHKMIPLQDCPLETISPELAAQGFAITGHHLEIYGLCQACQQKLHKTAKKDA